MEKIIQNIAFAVCALLVMLAGCQSMGDKDTIARLRNVRVEIKEEKVEDGLRKAMSSYERFLEETPDSAMAPEAIRRLADLKIEKEYGTIVDQPPAGEGQDGAVTAAEKAAAPQPVLAAVSEAAGGDTLPVAESDTAFEKRTTQSGSIRVDDRGAEPPVGGVDDLKNAGAQEAIALYAKLLQEYPSYGRNDQVLYQMARAHEELGQVDAAMAVMDRMVREHPGSKYTDEVQFRRAEYFFMRKRYLDAEEAYKSIINAGEDSFYYELALYKLGWTYYKQELYEDALHRFIALLDYKVAVGYNFAQTEDEAEQKRTEDTFRVISLSFSNLGGAEAVVEYFAAQGQRSYEDLVYRQLGEFYFHKRRYADATATYTAFVSRNPFHKAAPGFHMRIIEIHTAGGFPSLVLESKKAFATTYGLKADYWKHFEPSARPDVLENLKINLNDLASHYHASCLAPEKEKDRPANFKEALHWYREFLASFPADTESPVINYHMADLLMENGALGQAAAAYERTAYGYPLHDQSAAAGYAAVYAYREHLAAVPDEEKLAVKREVVRTSLKFADTFPDHNKAAIVLGAAAEDLFAMKSYEEALAAATKLIQTFTDADTGVTRSAWLVRGHASYELQRYAPAETAYTEVLALLPPEDETRAAIVDNLAASIYQQGQQANAAGDYRVAAEHYLRVGQVAPASAIRANAEFDGATALMQLEEWTAAAAVLTGFRNLYPKHALQPEVTKKIAYVYKESGQHALAAKEYERIEREATDDQVRQEALLIAAELYTEVRDDAQTLAVYRRYVDYFPEPVPVNVETRQKIAEILKAQKRWDAYMAELRRIVAIDAAAAGARTPRTRYLAAKAGLVLAEADYDAFIVVRLEKPIASNLLKKKACMQAATEAFTRLLDYEIGEVTAAATYYLAEIYIHFSQALLTSERPEGLDPLALEQYALAIEEQAYPFEEKGIGVHESNVQLIPRGVYNEWTKRSLQKLAKLMPARYDKPEAESAIIGALETYAFEIKRPVPENVATAADTEDEAAFDAPGVTNAPDAEETTPLAPATEAVPEDNAVPDDPGAVVENKADAEEKTSQAPAPDAVPEDRTAPVEPGAEDKATSEKAAPQANAPATAPEQDAMSSSTTDPLQETRTAQSAEALPVKSEVQ